MLVIASGWEPERPEAKSLWLLPSGPDQVGDSLVRPTPGAHMGNARPRRKFTVAAGFMSHSRSADDRGTAQLELPA